MISQNKMIVNIKDNKKISKSDTLNEILTSFVIRDERLFPETGGQLTMIQ